MYQFLQIPFSKIPDAFLLLFSTAFCDCCSTAFCDWFEMRLRKSLCLISYFFKTFNRVVKDNQVVEESIMTFTHSDTLDWMLPGVRPTNKHVTIPMMSVMQFNAKGKIAAKRVYWDQASVLRQIGVLPKSLYCKANASEVVLPVLDHKIAAALAEEQLIEKNVFLEPSSTAGLTSKAIQQLTEAPVTPSKNKIAAHGIVPFGEEAVVRPSPLRPKTDVFSIEPVASADDSRPVTASSQRSYQKTSVSRIFSDDNDDEVTVRPSSRVLQQPGGRSSDIFNNEPLQVRTSIPIDPRRFESHFSLSDEASEAPVYHGRRMFADRTNDSHFSFGYETSAVVAAALSKSETTSKILQSSISLSEGAGAVPEEKHRNFKDHNKSHFAFGTEEVQEEQNLPPYHTGKKTNSHANDSHFSLAMTEVRTKPEEPQTIVENVADLPAAGDIPKERPHSAIRRNPNARSEEAVSRPSSRVLKAPGGGTTFSFA